MNNNSSAAVVTLIAIFVVGGLVIRFASDQMRDDPLAVQEAGSATLKSTKGQPTAWGIEARRPWLTSTVVGSPEPPPPLRTKVAFPKLHRFKNPTVITNAPGTNRMFVAEHNGKIYSFEPHADVEQADLMVDIKQLVEDEVESNPDSDVKNLAAIYGMTFHPKFAENGLCYVAYVVNGNEPGQYADGTRVAQFKVTNDDQAAPTIDPASQKIVIAWLQGGHNGGCLKFGPDGFLYISTGDGGFANPPDGRDSGQDVSNLLSCVLRIDVDSPTGELAYSVPKDNPFVDLKDARPEIWAYGFRNPWKMSFDRKNGDLWVGDVGWELWELVYRVERAANYGWSIVEGHQSVHPERKIGPTPITSPTVEVPHTDGASITGGFVYRGKKFPEIEGEYIFGDWETRRIWGVKWDGKKASPKRDIAPADVRLVGFAEDNEGELYLMDYDNGTVHEFVRNEVAKVETPFPIKLSETGLFEDVAGQIPAAGVIPFSVNVEQWMDGGTAERFVAVPGADSIVIRNKAQRIAGSMFQRAMDFPTDTVFVKTIGVQDDQQDPAARRRVETQLLHWDGYTFQGYSYAWNAEQTDAELVERSGRDVEIPIKDANGEDSIWRWHFASRMECARCHNPWAEYTLAFNVRQLNRPHGYEMGIGDQLSTLEHIQVIKFESPKDSDTPTDIASLPRFAEPQNKDAKIDDRARAYLHVNCAHCHRQGGGGTAYIELQVEKPIHKTNALDVRPTQGTFGIPEAQILAAGDPLRSVLYYRLSKLGRGRMPHIGSELVDEDGVRLIHDWIRQLPLRPELDEQIKRLRTLDEPTAVAKEAAERDTRLDALAEVIAKESEREEPNDEDRSTAITRDQAAEKSRSNKRGEQRAKIIGESLATMKPAIELARVMREQPLPPTVSRQILDAAGQVSNPLVRDLFEHFTPSHERAKKLGSVVNPQEILALPGDANRGRALFASNATQCKNCHKFGDVGKELGPDLSTIGKKQSREQLLESILQPSKRIEAKYVTHIVITVAGKSHTGLLVRRDDAEIVLKQADGKDVIVKADDVDELVTQRVSLMPDLQVKDLTAQQVADLLELLLETVGPTLTTDKK